MNILGSTDIPLVFPPQDQVRNVTVRVLEVLPYGLIVAAAFLPQNGSMINFADGGGFRPIQGSPWVPTLFVAAGKHQMGEGGANTPGWYAVTAKKRGKGWRTAPTTTEAPDQDTAPWEHFCAIKPDSAKQEPPDIAPPSTVPVLGESRVGRRRHSAMETILRKTGEGARLCQRTDGSVSHRPPKPQERQLILVTRPPKPQERQLKLVTPVAPYDLELGAKLGVARGVQLWYP